MSETTRCAWCQGSDLLTAYHDEEWGRPAQTDVDLFGALTLETFQSGLSWLTVLRKRDAFRSGFAEFDVGKVSGFGEPDVTRLLADAGIIRHRGKIEAAVNNAKRAVELRKEFGALRDYFKAFAVLKMPKDASDALAKPLSKDLKSRGWNFVGPATVYAFMQSVGLVNDHVPGCVARERSEAERLKAWG
ncbi:MAG: DNA-3-methyladenine glycosylase I [Ramlibacter sp.]|nr:DNA-3-methyladenine glycosylase I [Ramlibacter sp.]